MNKKEMLALIAKLKAANPAITNEEITAEIKKQVKALEGEKEKEGALADSILKTLEGEEEEGDEGEDDGEGEENEEEPAGTKIFKGIKGAVKKAYKISEDGDDGEEVGSKFAKVDKKAYAKGTKDFRNQIHGKTLTVGTGGGATILVPKVVSNEILKEAMDELNFVAECDVVQLGKGNEYTYTVREERISKPVTGSETGAPATGTEGKYSEIKIGLESLETYPSISKTTLMDVDYPVENDIKAEMTEDFSDILETKFVTGTGDGISGIEGVIKNTKITVIKTATAGTATSSDLSALIRAQKQKYRKGSKLYISDDYETVLTNEKDTTGKKLWNGGDQTKGTPATFDGYPVGYLKDLPNIATGTKVAVFVNMKKCYKPVIKKEIIMTRDEITNPKLVKLFTQIRAGGRVVRPWFAVILEVK